MQTFTRSKKELVKGILYIPCVALLLFFASGLFTQSTLSQVSTAVIGACAAGYFILVVENVKIIVTPEGVLQYYENHQIKQLVPLPEHSINYTPISGKSFLFSATDYRLFFTPSQQQGKRFSIDCSSLGAEQYSDLLKQLCLYSPSVQAVEPQTGRHS